MRKDPAILHHDIHGGAKGERLGSLPEVTGKRRAEGPRHRNQNQSKQCISNPRAHEKTTPTSLHADTTASSGTSLRTTAPQGGVGTTNRRPEAVFFLSKPIRSNSPAPSGASGIVTGRPTKSTSERSFFQERLGCLLQARPQVVRRRSIQVLRPHRAGKTVLARLRWRARSVAQIQDGPHAVFFSIFSHHRCFDLAGPQASMSHASTSAESNASGDHE